MFNESDIPSEWRNKSCCADPLSFDFVRDSPCSETGYSEDFYRCRVCGNTLSEYDYVLICRYVEGIEDEEVETPEQPIRKTEAA